MGVLRQRVGAAQHEEGAVQHVVQVEDPGRRHVHDVALEHLDADGTHQHDHQPGGSLADPGADAVDRVQETLDAHVMRTASAGKKFIWHKAPPESCCRMVPCRNILASDLLGGSVGAPVVCI